MLPPKGYCTAAQAKRLLGNASDGTLRYYTIKGQIEHLRPEGRYQGFYKKEDVLKVAQRLRDFYGKGERTIQFSRGTVSDLPECEELLIHSFGSNTPVNAFGHMIPANGIERRATWVEKNADVFYILRVDGKLVGCAFLLPLSQEKIARILENEITPPILAEDIDDFSPGKPLHLYIVSVCVSGPYNAEKRFYGSRLLNGLLRTVVNFGKQGIRFETIVSRSTSADGIGFLRHIGFAEIESVTKNRNFIIEVGKSGIPEVMKYKHALAEWQGQNP
jgi:hypothetical protein